VARNTLEAWIPEEWDSSRVIQSMLQVSAVESLAARIPMGSDTKHVPRTAGMGVDVVAKGGAYGEDTSLNDEVLLCLRSSSARPRGSPRRTSTTRWPTSSRRR
jgi:hypothetical protein